MTLERVGDKQRFIGVIRRSQRLYVMPMNDVTAPPRWSLATIMSPEVAVAAGLRVVRCRLPERLSLERMGYGEMLR